MNYSSNNSSTSPAFSLQQSDEINSTASFHVISSSSIDPFQQHHHHSTIIHEHQQQTLLHHVVPPWPTNNSTLSFKLDNKGQASRRAPSSDDAMKKKKKKMEHRETERQRRLEMTALYKDLRSKLPLEYIQGKRSICDHMSEAINYIKHKEKTIKELSERRDRLMKICRRNNNSSSSSSSSSCSENDNINVIVQPSRVGIEVVISTNLRVRSMLPLSSVLELLLEEGLSVVSCVSSNANETSVHNIQSEVRNTHQANIEMSELQQKLMNLVMVSSASRANLSSNFDLAN